MSDRQHDEDGVEELDDVIIAQETAAHVPKPRAQVATDHPSVVIAGQAVEQWNPGQSEPPRKLPTVPPLRRPDRTEKTVVIRDRKSLDRLRREASRPPRARASSGSRTFYLVSVAVLASLAAGTLLAALVNSANSEDAPSAAPSAGADGPAVAPAASGSTPVVDLEDLPVVKKKKKRKPAFQ